jgi:hypothetical protein
MTSKGRRLGILMLTAAGFGILGAVVGILMVREPTESLTHDGLARARELWRGSGINSYDMIGSAYEKTIEIKVRGGAVQLFLLDGSPGSSQRPEDYTVSGLFDTMERELELFGGSDRAEGVPGGVAVLRVRFHQSLGSPERFVRSAGGRSATFTINSLTPVQ